MEPQAPSTAAPTNGASATAPGGVPRIAPGTRADIGFANHMLARVIGFATGGNPPNVFTTLARHRRLFRRWIRFAGALMPGGRLPRADTELLILRVSHLASCDYEWHHHERLARSAGLTADDVERVRLGPDAPGWSERQRLLLRAADELHDRRTISDGLWSDLQAQLDERGLIELCMLVGHYEMLAGTLNALRVQPDRMRPGGPPRLVRALERAAARRPRR
jgi:AhpD family alkylhydroperoxidase